MTSKPIHAPSNETKQPLHNLQESVRANRQRAERIISSAYTTFFIGAISGLLSWFPGAILADYLRLPIRGTGLALLLAAIAALAAVLVWTSFRHQMRIAEQYDRYANIQAFVAEELQKTDSIGRSSALTISVVKGLMSGLEQPERPSRSGRVLQEGLDVVAAGEWVIDQFQEGKIVAAVRPEILSNLPFASDITVLRPTRTDGN